MRQLPSALVGIIFISIAIVLFLSFFSYTPADLNFLSFPSNSDFQNLVGLVGSYIAFIFLFLLGYTSYVVPAYLLLSGLEKMDLIRLKGVAKSRPIIFLSSLFFLFCLASFLGLFYQTNTEVYRAGGIVGYGFSGFLTTYLGFWGSFILLFISLAVLAWMLAGYFFYDLSKMIAAAFAALFRSLGKIKNLFSGRPRTKTATVNNKTRTVDTGRIKSKKIKPEIKVYKPKTKPATARAQVQANTAATATSKKVVPQAVADNKDKKKFDPDNYQIPTFDILKVPPVSQDNQSTEDIQSNIKNLENTLANFGVEAKVVSVQKGPVVTMYELQPSSGVKIQKITTLADDIALAMKSSGVRVVAPIPGRGTVGIEIPNQKKHLVYLREVLEEDVFAQANSKLTLAIGKDVKGEPVVADLGQMPHLLIAGATGSGKTVCVNSLISSLIFKAKPDEVKFILVDPKKVELAQYKGIPHLLHPIISNAKKACSALNWAVAEMEKRYRVLADAGVRNINTYNKDGVKMPYLVVIVDELADLMVVARDKIETSIQRLAQLSRAVGIHLILATQRPSVDVITGVIKANFPARISFKVSSKVDSRTVLDMMGAEKLLGKGDCLFVQPSAIKATRAQASFIDDQDLNALTNNLRSQGAPIYEEGIIEVQKKSQSRLEGDELLPEAIKVILTTQQASASLLQRRLRVGYTRAARLLDLMEEQGVVGAFRGSKAREILVDPNQYLQENKLI
jgi:S-DNA-T family DNA segregation ATPase FtsK/SpoIIIE